MTASSRWRAAFAAAAATAVLTAAPVLGAQSALAQPYPPGGGQLTLSATTVDPEDVIDFTGTGFQAHQPVEVDLASRIDVLGHFTADGTGQVQGTVTIPRRAEAGEHLFLLRAKNPDLTLSAEITVEEGAPGGGHDGGGNGHDGGGNGHDDHGKPGQDDGGKPGHHGGRPGHDDGGRPDYEDGGRPHLAHTGENHTALLLGSGAAGLLLLGGGAMLLTRRMKRD